LPKIIWRADGDRRRAVSGKKYAQAEKYYLQAYQKNPDDLNICYHLGLCCYFEHKLTEASSYCRQVLRLQPRNAEAQALLDRLEKDDADGLSHLELGIQWYRLGEYSFALMEFSQSLLQDPGSVEAQFNLAATRYKMGQMAEAEAEIEECLRLEQAHPGALYLRGVLHEALGESVKAQDSFNELSQTNHNDTYAKRAAQRMALFEITPTTASFYGSVKTFSGFNQTWGLVGEPGLDTSALDGELCTLLGWSQGGGAGVNVYISSGWAETQLNGVEGSEVWKNLGISCGPAIARNWTLVLADDVQLQDFRSQEQYGHEQATAGFQFQHADLAFQILGQWLWEEFPPTPDTNSNSALLTLAGGHPLGGGCQIQCVYSRRWNQARNTILDFDSNGLSTVFNRDGATWGLDGGGPTGRLSLFSWE
jgi:tetratricopeptide (TPR) repeat protein